ncbi:MAG TPA: FAD-dependent oxidoreductase [Firmicutes bacterium]|nr:FAD-dependent oxidoreductase [Candidatus Fermentithermobacillaceae bacterium]
MRKTELAIVGAGPAGICAALEAASHGVKTTVIDRGEELGGQLIKQTHKFFGWHKKSAGTRGILIAKKLSEDVRNSENITVLNSTEALGYYDDGTLLVETPQGIDRVIGDRMIVATGASERMILFPGNDLPGVYGAGAVQTLMNAHGVRPGQSVLMIGSGNIGLIVSYQLLQAGVRVEAVVEAMPTIGGYAVHASKIRRLGVPILTRHTIKEAYGKDQVEGAIIWELDDSWNGIPGTEKDLKVDVICLAVGLSPLAELLWQCGAEMAYIPELGGFVPLYDENMETTRKGVFVAGDVAGIEEASTAMAAGRLAGLSAARSLGKVPDDEYAKLKAEILAELEGLRSGPASAKIRSGLAKMREMLQAVQAKELAGGEPRPQGVRGERDCAGSNSEEAVGA